LFQVPIKRVHLFTIIQLACLACLWTIKSFSTTSILFPLMLVVMIGIRKALDLIFTRRELKILDDIMPEMTKRNQMLKDDEVGCGNKFARFLLGPRLITSEYKEKDGADCVLNSAKLDQC
jgi:sodium bicarbonate transporter 10